MLLTAVILSLPLFLAPIAVDAQSTGNSTCQDVHLFLARGDDEEYPGRIGNIATDICSGVSNCDYEDIAFTSVSGSVYCTSVAEGANNGISQVIAYNKKCPNAKLVLAGYSLGAHIVGDVLGGGGGVFYNCEESTVSGNLNPSTAPGNMIAAALLFGDVRYTLGQSYNEGTGAADEGKYPRADTQLASLNLFAGKLHSYCLSTDPICAQGNDGESHTTYMTVYGADATAWTLKMLGGQGGSSQSSSVSSAPAPTTSSSTQAPTTSSSSPSSSSSSSSSLSSSVTSSPSPSSTSAASTSASASSSSTSPATTTSSSSTAAETSIDASPTPSVTSTGAPLSTGAKAGIAVGAFAGVACIVAGLYALFINHRRRQRKAEAEGGAGIDEPGTHYGRPAGMLERDTSYSRVAAQDAAQGLALPQMVHEHDRNRDSNGTTVPLVRYGDADDSQSRFSSDGRYSRHSDDIANGRGDDRYSRYSDDGVDKHF